MAPSAIHFPPKHFVVKPSVVTKCVKGKWMADRRDLLPGLIYRVIILTIPYLLSRCATLAVFFVTVKEFVK